MSDETPMADLSQFDKWLEDESDVAALVMKRWLEPVEGKEAIIFPPTYNLEQTEGARRFKRGEHLPGWYENSKGQAYGYNVDAFQDGSSVCQIDSVGSQANRMEPIFGREQYRRLVPTIVVKATVNGLEKTVNLLEAGHRAADAIVRFSDLSRHFDDAFQAIKDRGDAEPMARLAPTSLIFGAWDSRGTQVKLPRIVRSVIRAYNVRYLHRSAQYAPPIDYVGEGLLEAPEGKTQEESMSELGLRHAPAPWTHGGVQVNKEIRRDATVNLAAVRTLRALAKDPLPLRRYLLGLALVAVTAPQETFLREGCQLVPDAKRSPECQIVRHDGQRESWNLSHPQVTEYARQAAKHFKIGESRDGVFNNKGAKTALAQSKEERKKARRTESTAQNSGS